MDRDGSTTLRFEHNGQEIVLEAQRREDGWRVRLPDGSFHDIQVCRLLQNAIQVTEGVFTSPPVPLLETRCAGGKGSRYAPVQPFASEGEKGSCLEKTFRISLALEERSTLLAYEGQNYRFTPVVGRRVTTRTDNVSGLLTAPMAGLLADVMVAEGERVIKGQPLAVIEAMKVMTMLDAPFAGKVHKVYVPKAQRVEQGAPVVEIVADGPPELESENDRAVRT